MEFLKDILGEELYGQVSEKLEGVEGVRIVNGADGSFVPKDVLDRERETVKTYKKQLGELKGTLSALQAENATFDDVKGQLNSLQQTLAAKDAEMAKQRLQYGVRDAVRDAKARNIDVVSRMIDMSKVAETDGGIVGLSEQLESLRKSDAYLFEDAPKPTGGVPPMTEQTPNNVSVAAQMNEAIRKMAGR